MNKMKMNKIKTYKEFSVNEELTRDQRTYLLLPWALISKAGQKLFNIHPLLNLRWSELNKRTKDSNFDPIFGEGSNSKIDCNINKINKSELPKSLRWAMLLRSWNVYVTDKKSSDERSVIYISKEELNKGDTCIFARLNDRDVYPEKGKVIKQGYKIEDPVIIMVAKYSFNGSDVTETVNDLFLDMTDDYEVEVNNDFNLQGDEFFIWIKPIDYHKPIELKPNNKFLDLLSDSIDRVSDFLSSDGFNFKYEVEFNINGDLIYIGENGRFKEIIDKVKNDYDAFHYVGFTPKLMVNYLQYKDIKLGIDEIKDLLQDFNNCYYHLSDKSEWNIRSESLKISKILIKFKPK